MFLGREDIPKIRISTITLVNERVVVIDKIMENACCV